MAEPEKTEGEEEDAHAPDETDGDAAEPGREESGEAAPQAPAPDEDSGPPPVAVSVFVADPEGLPATLASPFWAALPRVDELLPLSGCAPVRPATELRVAHDARHLACHVLCKEPDMGLVRTLRTGEVGRLDLDDSVEILLDPYRHGFAWSFRATPSGEWETIVPVGAVARPECIVEVRTGEKSWEALFRIPFADVGLEGDLRGTPVDGESWGFAVVRRRREAARGKFKGLREVAALSLNRPGELAPGDLASLGFQGGRTVRPLDFTRYAAGGFGVNEICVAFEGGKIPPGVEVALKPAPAKKLRSKDASRYKFRVARPGLYRYSVRIPYQPPPEPTEEEIAEWERELGRELEDEELARKLDERTGTAEYVAGLSFLLRDVWTEIEEMEDAADRMREDLSAAGVEITRDTEKLFDKLERALNEVDGFRTPHAKGRLGPEEADKLEAAWANLRGTVRRALLRRGRLSIASPYFAGGEWHLGALRVAADKPGDAALVRKLKEAGLSFCAFADRVEAGSFQKVARRRASGEKGAAGKSLISKSWELSAAEKFVVLRAAEVGPHYPALCLGLPPDGIPVGSADGYQAIDLAQEAGGVAVMCEAPGDLRELPVELTNVLGLSGTGSAPVDAWERLLRTGRRFVLFPGTRLVAGELPGKGLPERAMLVGVLAESLTDEAILAALRRGSFYLTTATGPRFTGIEVKGGTVTVRTAEPCQLLFRDETGAVLSGTFGAEAKYRFTGRETYVRAVALADVLEDGFRLEATTQAFYVADELPKSPVGPPDADWTIAEPVDRSGEPEEEEEPEEKPGDELPPEEAPEEETEQASEEGPPEREPPEEQKHAEEAQAQEEARTGPEAAQVEETEPTEEAEEEPAGEVEGTEDGEAEVAGQEIEGAEEGDQPEEPGQTEQVEETEEAEEPAQPEQTEQTEEVEEPAQPEQTEQTEEVEEVEEGEEAQEGEEDAEAQDTEDAGDAEQAQEEDASGGEPEEEPAE